MNVKVLLNLDDVVRFDLSGQRSRRVGDEPLMKVLPDFLLFQKRIHSGKRRWHELSPFKRPALWLVVARLTRESRPPSQHPIRQTADQSRLAKRHPAAR